MDTVEVTLTVTVQVCSLSGDEPDQTLADNEAKMAVEETLNNANNRGYNHPNSDAVGVNVSSVEIAQ